MTKYNVDGQAFEYNADGQTLELTEDAVDVLRKLGHTVTQAPDYVTHDGGKASDYGLRVHENSDGADLQIVGRRDNEIYFTRDGLRALRNALTDILGDAPAQPTWITVDSPEPDRSKTYKDADGDPWTYDNGWDWGTNLSGTGRTWYQVTSNFSDSFPWRVHNA